MILPAGMERIFLIGLMGAGKTTVGKKLAEVLGWDFIDLDGEIEVLAGMSVPQIFKERGETLFRELEAKAIQQTIQLSQVVVACGGGVVSHPENQFLLKREMTIWLELTPAEAAKRLEQVQDRPLLQECEDTVARLNEILVSRRDAYATAARIRVNSGALTPAKVVSKILTEIGIDG